MRHGHRILGTGILLGFLVLTACGDTTGPEGDDVNPALLEATGGVGGALSAGDGLPQGSARFTGPGGLLMDATAEEFIQQITTQAGEVWKTSGINVRAVPDESVVAPALDRVFFGAAVTGSLESVGVGAYSMIPEDEWPDINFLDRAPVHIAGIRVPGERTSQYADEGVFEITSVEYGDELHTCQVGSDAVEIDRCDYQLGTLRGNVWFNVPTADGSVVQEATAVTVPIRRRTIVGRFKDF